MENLNEMYKRLSQNTKELFGENALPFTGTKSQPYLDKSYSDKRRILREYSIKEEIKEYVDMICDEIISQNKPTILTSSIQANDIFNDILRKLGYDNNITIWHTLKDFLIDGFLALEIIWEKDKIKSFNRLNPETLVPAYEKDLGNYWIQYPTDKTLKRILLDSQLIFISYSAQNDFSETSYVEGLIRPYNILSNIEKSLVMASIKSATTYQKFKIPVKGLSKTKAEDQIADLISNYSDDVEWDDTLGTLKINGEKHLPYNRQYWFPETDFGEYEMTNLKNDFNLGNYMDSLKYFKHKLKKASKFPDETNAREIKRFDRFISLIRNNFKEIIEKPFKLVLENNDIKDISYDIFL